MEDYAEYDGLALAKMVRDKDVSALELVEAAIARIEKHNPALNAVVYKAYDEARAAAQEEIGDGLFAGVPFLMKDLDASVAGWRRTNGSRYTKDEICKDDSELVNRYRDAGLMLLGATNTPEFGITGTTESGLLGPCRNPWNTDHITGGSSGGSAAAVAAGIVPLAHATDGLGSIRIPAACCGLVGLKTTRDRTPNAPNYREASHGFVVQHVVSRTVRDTAAMLDATDYKDPALPDALPPKTRPFMEEIKVSPGRMKIAWSLAGPSGKQIGGDVERIMRSTLKLLEAQGHWIEEHDLDVDWRALYDAQSIKSGANFRAEMRHRIRTLGREPAQDELEPLTWSIMEATQGITGEMLAEATRSLYALCADILQKTNPFDAYLLPVMTEAPPPIGFLSPVDNKPGVVNGRQGQLYPYTAPFNMTGQPAISLPLGMSENGLPIGLQFVGRYGDEATLLRLAASLEEADPWIGRRPTHWN
ncbi:MAG: amidase [Alphaproteobacteria bacterium]